MFCHRNVTLLPMGVNISSGIGISRTVSNPSSLSMFGQSLLRDDFAAACFISLCVSVSVGVLLWVLERQCTRNRLIEEVRRVRKERKRKRVRVKG